MLSDKKFIGIVVFKIALLTLFSSCYQNALFIPFVRHFLDNLDNPWQYFYLNNSGVEFPYHPVMLYALSLSYLPVKLLHLDSFLLDNLFFKLPTLLADVLIAWLLLRIFPRRKNEVLVFYFLSPIILYSCYMHSQIDLLPTALLFLSVYLITRRKVLWSAVAMGLAVCMKLHVLAAVPLVVIYIFKNNRKKDLYAYLLYVLFIYVFVTLPFITSEGFHAMVLSNKKQSLLFDTLFSVGHLNLYLPIFAAFLIYMRFAFYNKINHDLFYTFIGMLFSMFVFLVYPSPGWYTWILPFLSIFFIKLYPESKKVMLISGALSAAYILYFVFFNIPEFCELTFLRTPVELKVYSPELRNISFTLLETTLFGTVYSLYRFGVKSNSIYRKNFATVIGIGGDSGSGKSTLLSDVKMMLKDKVLEIEGDADHKWDRYHLNWQRYTQLDPKANFLHRQASQILALKMWKPVQRANYDHGSGKFTEPVNIAPRDFIIISGLHTFYLPLLRRLIDIKIYLDTDDKLRKHWKVVRDMKERGYSREAVLAQLEKRRNDSEKYIDPQRNFADIIIRYYSEDNYEIGGAGAEPRVKLMVTLSASFHLEDMVDRLISSGVEIEWDYADNLNSQYIVLHKEPDGRLLEEMMSDLVANVDELITGKPVWADGYRGFVQLVILKALSEKAKESDVSVQV